MYPVTQVSKTLRCYLSNNFSFLDAMLCCIQQHKLTWRLIVSCSVTWASMTLYLYVLGENFSIYLLDTKPISVPCPSQHDKGHYSDTHAPSLYIRTVLPWVTFQYYPVNYSWVFKRYLAFSFIDNSANVPRLSHAWYMAQPFYFQ